PGVYIMLMKGSQKNIKLYACNFTGHAVFISISDLRLRPPDDKRSATPHIGSYAFLESAEISPDAKIGPVDGSEIGREFDVKEASTADVAGYLMVYRLQLDDSVKMIDVGRIMGGK